MSPAEVIQRHLEAYNNRDLESFLDFFSEDVELCDLRKPDNLTKGTEELRAIYEEVFNSSPNLHAAIIHRTVLNQFVIDEEVVKGLRGKTELTHVVVIYLVVNNKINKVWICR
jgi:hypothetical protein